MTSNPDRHPAKEAEFDTHAGAYAASVNNPLKRLMGKSADAFILAKVRWLLDDLRRRPLRDGGKPRLLDYGCGAGVFLHLLAGAGFTGSREGCDVSAKMLEQARARWPAGAEQVPLHHVDPQQTSLESESFDVITASCVLHHVMPADRNGVLAEIARMLKPGGRLVIFEHNPLNPLTRWMVSRSPLDVNAVLLDAGEGRELASRAGLSVVRRDYILFVPPRLSWLRPLERLIGWLPLGGQYALVAEKPPAARIEEPAP